MRYKVQRLVGGSLQRQLTTGVVLVVVVLMSYFVWDMNRYQRQMAVEQDSSHILAIAHGLSTASAIALASRDLSGLAEMVKGVSRYPDFKYAMVLDVQGQVLAHTDRSRLGQYVTDLPARLQPTLLQSSAELIDAASPVLLNGHPLGWVRLGTSGQSLQANLSQINQNSVLHLLFVLGVSVLFASLGSRVIARRLHAISRVARHIEAGDSKLRVKVEGNDETAQLALQFNNMLDALAKRDAALKTSDAFKSAILNSVAAEVAVISGEGVILEVNDQWQQFARDNASALGHAAAGTGVGANYLQACRAASTAVDAYGQQACDGIAAVLDGRLPTFSLDYPCHSPALRRWFTMVVRPLGTDDMAGAVISHTDISAVKWAEQYEHFRGQILEMMANNSAIQDLLLAMICGVEQLHPGSLCSVQLLSEDGVRVGQSLAPSLPTFFNQAMIGLEIGQGQGSCGTAAATGERVIVADIAHHPYWARFKSLALRAGLAACWSQPVFSATGSVLGTFAIYHTQVHEPSDTDIDLIQKVARLAGIAMDHLNTQSALRTSENVFRTLFETSPFGIVYETADGRISAANPAATRILGLSLDQLQGRTSYDPIWRTVHEDGTDYPGETHPIVVAFKTGKTSHDIMGVEAPGRGRVWISVTGTPLWEGDKVVQAYAVFEDITETYLLQQQVRQLAFYDALTLLPNRRLLTDRLDHALSALRRSGNLGALMYLDLDNFKPLNDVHGHDAGDLLLLEVAHRLRACVREQDTVARMGGDEFVVMLVDLHADAALAGPHACSIGDKICASLAAPYELACRQADGSHQTVQHYCTASVGVTLFSATDTDQEQIMRRADAAMYQAKVQGRNRVLFAAAPGPTS